MSNLNAKKPALQSRKSWNKTDQLEWASNDPFWEKSFMKETERWSQK
jgi:hypothetical protein